MMQKTINYLRIAQKTVQLGNEIEQAKGRFPTFLVGTAGEYLVMSWLKEKKVKFKPKGGQAGYDLELQGGARIEVRTSLLKDEGLFSKEERIRNYGWRLKDKGKEMKFDYVFCVALDKKKLDNSRCYVLTKDEAEKAPSLEFKRFKKVEKRLWIYVDLATMKKAKIDKPEYVPKWEEEINRNKDNYLLENRLKLFETPNLMKRD
jgi:hypothetical protein